MNSLFSALIVAGVVAGTPVIAQTNTGPSTPQTPPAAGSTGSEQVNPRQPDRHHQTQSAELERRH